MRQDMLTLSEAPSTTSHLDIYILSIFHYLGCSLNCTLIFDLMRNLYTYNVYIYIHSMIRLSPWLGWLTDRVVGVGWPVVYGVADDFDAVFFWHGAPLKLDSCAAVGDGTDVRGRIRRVFGYPDLQARDHLMKARVIFGATLVISRVTHLRRNHHQNALILLFKVLQIERKMDEYNILIW